jgi:hypothetical protein
MDYFESAEGLQITLTRALAEVNKHGLQSEVMAFMADDTAPEILATENN